MILIINNIWEWKFKDLSLVAIIFPISPHDKLLLWIETSSLISISAHLLNLASDSSDNLISLYNDSILSQA